MPTIVNPYRTNNTQLATAIRNVGESLFGDQLTPALKREKLRGLQRENVETENLMRAVNTGDAFDWASIAPAIVGSGYDPQDFNVLNRGRSAALYGARDPRTQAAQIGAGSPFSATAEAFDMGEATTRRGQDIASSDRRYNTDRDYDLGMFKFLNEPEAVSVDGENVFLPRGELVTSGASPVTKRAEMGPAAVYNEYYDLAISQGYDEAAAKQYAMTQAAKRSSGMKISTGPDGETTVEMGGIGGLTNNVRSNVQKQAIAAAEFNNLADIADDYLEDENDANLFGITGTLRQTGQGAAQALNNIGMTVGGLTQAREELAATGLGDMLPELYDPDLDAVDTVWGMIVYKGAAALAGQEGRSVSDKDIQQFRQILGDPKSMFASQASMRAKLDIARRIVSGNQDIRKRAMTGQSLESATKPVPTDTGPAVDVPTPQNAGRTPDAAVEVATEADALNQPIGTYVKLNGRVFKVEE